MSVLVTGADGQLGRALVRRLGRRAVGLDLPELDVTDAAAVRAAVRDVAPSAVINCAAYTAVDQAETDRDACFAVNAAAVGWLADACAQADCPLMHISTDYVFAGAPHPGRPFTEADKPAPRGVYATSKFEGERLAASWRKHYVVRTCGLYGLSPRNNNFVEAMLRAGASRSEVRVVEDQRCTPTYVGHLAAALLFLLETEAFGLYHIVHGGQATWREFAEEIFRQAELAVAVRPITTDQYGAPAPRPRYSVLDTSKYHALGGPVMPHWKEGLRAYLRERPSGGSPHPPPARGRASGADGAEKA